MLGQRTCAKRQRKISSGQSSIDSVLHFLRATGALQEGPVNMCTFVGSKQFHSVFLQIFIQEVVSQHFGANLRSKSSSVDGHFIAAVGHALRANFYIPIQKYFMTLDPIGISCIKGSHVCLVCQTRFIDKMLFFKISQPTLLVHLQLLANTLAALAKKY